MGENYYLVDYRWHQKHVSSKTPLIPFRVIIQSNQAKSTQLGQNDINASFACFWCNKRPKKTKLIDHGISVREKIIKYLSLCLQTNWFLYLTTHTHAARWWPARKADLESSKKPHRMCVGQKWEARECMIRFYEFCFFFLIIDTVYVHLELLQKSSIGTQHRLSVKVHVQASRLFTLKLKKSLKVPSTWWFLFLRNKISGCNTWCEHLISSRFLCRGPTQNQLQQDGDYGFWDREDQSWMQKRDYGCDFNEGISLMYWILREKKVEMDHGKRK